LRHEDQNGQRVDEASDDRTRYILHQDIQAKETGNQLNYAHQDRGGKEIVDAVIPDQRQDQHCDRSRCRRNHPWASADQRNDHGDGKGSV
jgi:hypothetical protein